MKVKKRRCRERYTVTDETGASFTIEEGREYMTSTEPREGLVTVFSQYWVWAPLQIFEGDHSAQPAGGLETPLKLADWMDRFAAVLEAHERSANLYMEWITGLGQWSTRLRTAADPRPLAPSSKPFQDGQAHMRSRVADVLRGEHPGLAAFVEKLPLHGPSVDERVADAFDEALRVTKPLRDQAHDAARVTSDVMNMRLDAAEARPLAPPLEPGWHPIATAPKRETVFFWVVPKTPEESYVDTSGNPIVSSGPPRLHMGQHGTWGSLSKATHWMPLPAPPAGITPPQTTEKHEDDSTRSGEPDVPPTPQHAATGQEGSDR
jgi:hypothetical protein